MKSPDEIKRELVTCLELNMPPEVQHMAMQDALALIQQLEAKVPRWISVEERLPDKLKRVLVFKQRNEHALWHVAMWDIEIDWRGELDWSKNPDNGWFSVTHWMPLPEMPKEE